MEKWSYKRNGGIEGPVSKDELKSLYEAGKITRQTLVRSLSAGGGWRRYEEVADPRSLASSYIPRTVKTLWPWFVIGTPLVVGLVDVFLVQSTGNAFVESNNWLSHAPFALSIFATVLWLLLIWNEIRRKGHEGRAANMIVWIVAAPIYQAFSWWAAALVITLVNLSLGFGLASCQSDIAKAEVQVQFNRAAAKKGNAGLSAAAIIDTQQLWLTDRIRMCSGRIVAANEQIFPVRYKIEDRGASLFRNTMHGLYVTIMLE